MLLMICRFGTNTDNIELSGKDYKIASECNMVVPKITRQKQAKLSEQFVAIVGH